MINHGDDYNNFKDISHGSNEELGRSLCFFYFAQQKVQMAIAS